MMHNDNTSPIPVENVPFESLDPEQQAIFLEAMRRSGLDPEKFQAPNPERQKEQAK